MVGRSRAAASDYIPAPTHDSDDTHNYFATVIAVQHEFLVAERDGALVGMMSLAGDWVAQLYVDPDWQSRGLGSEFVNLAKGLRPEGLDLWTFQANAGARRFTNGKASPPWK